MVLQSPLQKFLILVYQTVECSHYYFPTTADNIHKSISQKISQQSAETLWPTITMIPCSIVTQEMEKVLFLRTFKISKVTAQITTGQQDNLSFLWHKQSLQLFTLIYPLWLACHILTHLSDLLAQSSDKKGERDITVAVVEGCGLQDHTLRSKKWQVC